MGRLTRSPVCHQLREPVQTIHQHSSTLTYLTLCSQTTSWKPSSASSIQGGKQESRVKQTELTTREKLAPVTQSPSPRAVKIFLFVPLFFSETPVGTAAFTALWHWVLPHYLYIHSDIGPFIFFKEMEHEGKKSAQRECYPFHKFAVLTYSAATVWEHTAVTPACSP